MNDLWCLQVKRQPRSQAVYDSRVASSTASSIEAVLKIEDGIVVVYKAFRWPAESECQRLALRTRTLAVVRDDKNAADAMRLLAEQMKAGAKKKSKAET